ncbi:MAG: phenylalanine--tRNA ligase subunit alpha [Deltaproteobacteria bacterium]|nr:phenylalanine--tRNA ligase subunit alpha [Deltaproteobacteria bacterium]
MSREITSIKQIQEEACRELEAAADIETIKTLSVRYLGRKGFVTLFLRNVSNLPASERPTAGKQANKLKNFLAQEFENRIEELQEKAAQEERDENIDVTLPGRKGDKGSLHPITIIGNEICDIFLRIGFDIAEGPEIETDYYNFEALNIPKDHPARDMQDTFYTANNFVLRTHTSPMQARVMEKVKPPVKIIAPGKVYRCDSDITHTPMFHQVEGLVVDENISFADLKGVLTVFIGQIFDRDTKMRFRPSFFPFTEPSAEVDISCVMCGGKGCRVCSNTGWIEILGSGMVHPAVFENAGYDSKKYSGFAFGMGIERIAMLKYGIDDIRKFFENDIRFIGQF